MNGPALRLPSGDAGVALRGEATAAGVARVGAPRFLLNGRFLTQPVTGVQRYAREIAAALDALLIERGERATLAVPGGGSPSGPQPRFKAFEIETVTPLRGHAWEQAVLPWWAGSVPLLNLCNTAPLLRGRRQVVCMHDANVFREPDSYSRAFRLTYQALLPRLARGGARLASVSTDAARQLAAVLPVRPETITVLPNGHEHAFRWQAARSQVLARLPAGRPFVLALGSRARHKNVGLLLGLAPRLEAAGLDLVVAGGGAGVFAETAIARHPNVHTLGRVADDDLAALLGAALCLAFPSLTEGFGLPVVEAMALGCPVVSSDRASLPEICGDAALMADPLRPDEWMAHFTRLMATPGLGQDMRARGRRQVERFSWRRSAAGYLDLLRP